MDKINQKYGTIIGTIFAAAASAFLIIAWCFDARWYLLRILRYCVLVALVGPWVYLWYVRYLNLLTELFRNPYE